MKYICKQIQKFKACAISLILGSLMVTLLAGPALADTDQRCLECHRDVGLSRMLATGDLISLYVNPEQWQTDIHHRKGITCTDCHRGMTPFSHPKEGAVTVACGRCHPEAREQNQLNIHEKFVGVTSRSLPECFDCHSKHGVKPKDDPDSSINPKNIGKICYSCHQELRPKVFMNILPTQILLGHRKCDVNGNFDLNECISCHGDAGHGPLEAYPDYCNECHNTRKTPSLFSETHSLSSTKDRPLGFLLKNMNLGLNLVLIIGVVFTVLIYVTRFHCARKK